MIIGMIPLEELTIKGKYNHASQMENNINKVELINLKIRFLRTHF